MDNWYGTMDWRLSPEWKCETCGLRAGLTWGIQHARCRCNACHTQYYMRDENKEVTDTPVLLLQEQYKEPARVGWEKYNEPISEWTDEQWDEVVGDTSK